MVRHLFFCVFSPNPWHDLWRNRQQIFSRLAGPNRVLYVEPARFALRDWHRGRVPWADLRRPTVVEERPNLYLYRIPAWLPIRGTEGRFDRLSNRLLRWDIRRTIGRLDVPTAALSPSPSSLRILWLYRPSNWRWAAAIEHDLLVYHVTDDYAAFGHVTPGQRQALLAAERELLAQADLTITTAPRLLELKRSYARRIAQVPNAVDYPAFAAALADPHPPTLVSTLPRPILGYSGHISGRLDLVLLRQLMAARPHWRFVFAGSQWDAGCAAELAALKAMPNTHFLGRLPVDQVPHFIAACDVCLIPYRIDDETRAISSLKLYEYLAAGKPVVSAGVPAAQEHAGVVHLAESTPESWIACIDDALAGAEDPALIRARQAVAAANTWEDRVAQISRLLEETLAG
jgi:glycosyltransferase involved in cell wall biosynthesis